MYQIPYDENTEKISFSPERSPEANQDGNRFATLCRFCDVPYVIVNSSKKQQMKTKQIEKGVQIMMTMKDSKKAELNLEQLNQVAGGKVGDVYYGWTCENCNESTATVYVEEDEEWIGPFGEIMHNLTFRHYCEVCGETWYTSSTQNMGKPKNK